MGIFRKILNWTNEGNSAAADRHRKAVAPPAIDHDTPVGSAHQILPASLSADPALGADSSFGEDPVVMSATLGTADRIRSHSLEEAQLASAILARDQTAEPFTSASDWEVEDKLQSAEVNRLALANDGFLDQVVDAFDEAFDEACTATPADASNAVSPIQTPADQSAIEYLFMEIAATYSQPVRNFVFGLRRGTATKDCIAFLRTSLQVINTAAASLDFGEVVRRIGDLDEALAIAQTTHGRLLDGETRDLILLSYDDLIKVLPEVFQEDEKGEQRRDDIIIKSLLQQIPGVGCVTLDKLYKAGLGSLQALFLANKDDLAAATSIPVLLCERIADKLQQYRREAQDRCQDDPQSAYRNRLTGLVAELRSRHEDLEQPPTDPAVSLATEKRRRRQLRQECFLEIVATLAELGEVELINKLHRLSFRQRLKRLADHLKISDGEGRGGPTESVVS